MTRESPWGPIEVLDAHVHFFSHSFFEKIVAQKPGLTFDAAAAQLGWKMPSADPAQLGQTWAAELDRHGVRVAALIGSVPGEEGSVVAAAKAAPGRFLPFAMVNPREWDSSQASDIRAVCLFPAMHRYSIQEDFVRPVFEWAAKTGGAVFVHCGVLSVGIRSKLGLKSAFDLRFSNPVDLHAVALEHPQTPIIVPHFGAGYFREALMLADLCPNVYLDTSSSNQWMRYQESHLDLRHVFRRALDVMGARRLLFGTDSSFFPRGWNEAVFEEQAKALYELGVSAHDARLIFGQNLLRILPLS
jgi:predicted TIM-barrel fold metal-dependent hydrolase